MHIVVMSDPVSLALLALDDRGRVCVLAIPHTKLCPAYHLHPPPAICTLPHRVTSRVSVPIHANIEDLILLNRNWLCINNIYNLLTITSSV